MIRRWRFASGIVLISAAAAAGRGAAADTTARAGVAPERGRAIDGIVLLVGEDDRSRPAAGVEIWIDGRGDTTHSLDHGEFRLYCPQVYRAGNLLPIQVKMKGYRLQGGDVRVPADGDREPIRLRLIPATRKSPLTERDKQRIASDIVARAHEQVTLQSKPGQVDLSRYLREWATKLGYSYEDVQSEMQRWAAEVEANRDPDLLKQGLAAFMRREFAQAVELSHDAAEQKVAQLEKVKAQQQELSAKAQALRESARTAFKTEGDAAFSLLRPEQSLRAYGRALELVSRNDQPVAWAAASTDVGRAEEELGIRVEGAALHRHLDAAVSAFTAALQVYTRDQLPRQWATTQELLAVVLCDLGRRTAGPQANELLTRSVKAYRLSLEVRTRDQFPEDWATTQNDLGIVLRVLGDQTAGQEGEKVLGQAIAAFKLALEVTTRAPSPQKWGTIQNNLGAALDNLGARTAGSAGDALLRDSVAAFKLALEVHTREQFPDDWAAAEHNLGMVFFELGARTAGPKASDLLRDSIAAYKLALEIRRRDQFPQDWAMTENNLGNSLSVLGAWIPGPEGSQLLADSITAYKAALEVRTREQLPQDWAATQINLGVTFRQLGTRTAGEKGRALLADSVAAFKLALQVATRDQFPKNWILSQRGLALSLAASQRTEEAAAAAVEVLALTDDDELVVLAGHAYQEELFRFDDARLVFAKRVERRPDELGARANLAEACFASGRTAEAQRQLTALLTGAAPPAARAPLRLLLVLADLRLGQRAEARAALRALRDDIDGLAKETHGTLGQPIWSFRGTQHVLASEGAFAGDRFWLIPIVGAFGDRNVAAMKAKVDAALKEAR